MFIWGSGHESLRFNLEDPARCGLHGERLLTIEYDYSHIFFRVQATQKQSLDAHMLALHCQYGTRQKCRAGTIPGDGTQSNPLYASERRIRANRSDCRMGHDRADTSLRSEPDLERVQRLTECGTVQLTPCARPAVGRSQAIRNIGLALHDARELDHYAVELFGRCAR